MSPKTEEKVITTDPTEAVIKLTEECDRLLPTVYLKWIDKQGIAHKRISYRLRTGKTWTVKLDGETYQLVEEAS